MPAMSTTIELPENRHVNAAILTMWAEQAYAYCWAGTPEKTAERYLETQGLKCDRNVEQLTPIIASFDEGWE